MGKDDVGDCYINMDDDFTRLFDGSKKSDRETALNFILDGIEKSKEHMERALLESWKKDMGIR